ncbi:MAG: hypothetical protein DLM52_12945, partial [Chthoniobacterales bacterium]
MSTRRTDGSYTGRGARNNLGKERACLTVSAMRTFGRFRAGDRFFYGEILAEEVHVLADAFWIEIQPTGEIWRLADLEIAVPVAPSKLIAVGLN